MFVGATLQGCSERLLVGEYVQGMNRSEKRRRRKLSGKAAQRPKPVQSVSSLAEPPAPAIRHDIDRALRHHAAGRLPEAGRLYQRILLADPHQPVALHMFGVIAHQRGNNEVAVDLISKALAAQPDYADAHSNLGAVFQSLGKLDEAAASYEKALAIRPDFAEAHYNLGNVLRLLGRLDEAVAAFEKALTLRPDYGEAMNNLGSALRYLGRLHEAQAIFERYLRLRHGGPWWNAASFGAAEAMSVAPAGGPLHASAFKLGDCIDQLDYLMDKGRIDRSFERMVERYRSVLVELLENPAPEAAVRLTADQGLRIGAFYDRVVHYPGAPRLESGAINRGLDFRAIEDEYLSSPVAAITFDDFLTPEALRSLRGFCLESTIFFNYTADRYVSSSNKLGFNCDLLYQMAEELKECLPRVLDGHALRNMWVYRYNNRSDGVAEHTDDGAVTFNFWITPDAANQTPGGGGGLVVYVKEQPLDWDWERYNKDKYSPDIKREIDEFLSDAESFTIPYGENRATLFNSRLFHQSSRVNFHDGFENRRMNVTMLFGQRGG